MLTKDPVRHQVILDHMHDTIVFLLAATQPCVSTRAKEVDALRPREKPQRTGRVLKPVEAQDLDRLLPNRSWGLVILLCPGDTTQTVAAFAKRVGPGWRDRLLFFHHPKTDLGRAFEAWVAAGLPPPLSEPAENFQQLNAKLGRAINEWIYQDHRSPAS